MNAKMVLNSAIIIFLLVLMVCTKRGATTLEYYDEESVPDPGEIVYADKVTSSYFNFRNYDVVAVDSAGQTNTIFPNARLVAVCNNGDLIVRFAFDLFLFDDYFLNRVYRFGYADPRVCKSTVVSRIDSESGEVIWQTDMSKHGRFDQYGVYPAGVTEPVPWDEIREG